MKKSEVEALFDKAAELHKLVKLAWFNKAYTGVIDQCQAHIAQNVANLSKPKS